MPLGLFDRIAKMAEARPGRVLCVILALHGLIWIMLPIALHDNLMRDQIEGFAWGQEWQWGYAKHPPLWAWILQASAVILGHASAIAAYAIGVGAGVLSLAIIWAMALQFAEPLGALIAVLTLDGILYFNFRTVDFNANVVLLPLWAGCGYFALRALRSGRFIDWLGLSLCLSVGLLGKYETGILALALAGFFLIDADARRHLAGPRPWLAGLIGILLLSPHLVWLVHHDFEPVDYAVARTGASFGWLNHLISPLSFLGAQIPECLGFFLMIAALIRPPGALALRRRTAPVERRLIWTLAAAPLGITTALAAITGLTFIARWAYPMFLFFGAAAVLWAPDASHSGIKRFFATFAAVSVLIMASFFAYFAVMPQLLHRSTKPQFPGRALAAAVDALWTRREDGRPLDYVIGDIWTAGNASFYLGQIRAVRPHVLIDGDFKISPWIGPRDLAREGGVILWLDEGQPPPDFLKAFPQAERAPSVTLPIESVQGLKPVIVGMALLPPQRAER